jgi:hypothetical protein
MTWAIKNSGWVVRPLVEWKSDRGTILSGRMQTIRHSSVTKLD